MEDDEGSVASTNSRVDAEGPAPAARNEGLSPSYVPQVCDRCRIKKIRCDGTRPKCGNCISAQLECTVSVKLRRKTKPRRYIAAKDEINVMDKVMAENESLKKQLKAAAFQSKESNSVSASSPEVAALPVSLQNLPSQSHPGLPTQSRIPDPVIKHLGRLITTDGGVDRFAGSTTGVHFVHTVEQKYQEIFGHSEIFPESMYKLHMLPQPKSLYSHTNNPESLQHLSRGLYQPRSYYFGKCHRFFRKWGTLQPILAPKQFFAGFHQVMDFAENRYVMEIEAKPSSWNQVCLVLAVDAWDDPGGTDSADIFFGLASETYFQITERGDLSSLQSLLLMALYFQLSGQHSMLAQYSGMAVRLAQSLGLHRHTRRFKFCAGELEMRSRIWWCTYILDMTSSICHGLPKLIQDEDVDTNLPFDCDFDDMNITSLPMALPGEATRFSLFLSYIRLSRILAKCTKQLYTTTQRRGGVEKIALLDHELRTWKHAFNSAFMTSVLDPLGGRGEDIDQVDRAHTRLKEDQEFTVPYLQLMSNFAMLLIYQPALTFDADHPTFDKGLDICVQTCTDILACLEGSQSERRLFYLQPTGTRLASHAALLFLYHRWNSTTIGVGEQDVDHLSKLNSTLATRMQRAIALLEQQISGYLAIGFPRLAPLALSPGRMLQETIAKLQTMTTRTIPATEREATSVAPHSFEQVGQHALQDMFDGQGMEMWQASALGGLNQLDMLEWTTDLASAPFDSYLMNFEPQSAQQ